MRAVAGLPRSRRSTYRPHLQQRRAGPSRRSASRDPWLGVCGERAQHVVAGHRSAMARVVLAFACHVGPRDRRRGREAEWLVRHGAHRLVTSHGSGGQAHGPNRSTRANYHHHRTNLSTETVDDGESRSGWSTASTPRREPRHSENRCPASDRAGPRRRPVPFSDEMRGG